MGQTVKSSTSDFIIQEAADGGESGRALLTNTAVKFYLLVRVSDKQLRMSLAYVLWEETAQEQWIKESVCGAFS